MLVSIYLPTRNRVDLLRNAVESALAQTYQEIELIVVDDASSDGTADYLRQKAAADSRLSVLRNAEWRGAAVSRNIAIRRSKGAFVTGLDDDDFFQPERIEEFVAHWEMMTSKGVTPALLYTQTVLLKGGILLEVTRRKPSVAFDDMFETNGVGNQIFAPRSHYFEAGLFDERLPAWQDLEFFMRVLKKFGPAYLVDNRSYVADIGPRSDRITMQEEKIREAMKMVSQIAAHDNAGRQLSLFLAMFKKHYYFLPRKEDWVRYWRFGGWPKGFLHMLRATAIQWARSAVGRR